MPAKVALHEGAAPINIQSNSIGARQGSPEIEHPRTTSQPHAKPCGNLTPIENNNNHRKCRERDLPRPNHQTGQTNCHPTIRKRRIAPTAALYSVIVRPISTTLTSCFQHCLGFRLHMIKSRRTEDDAAVKGPPLSSGLPATSTSGEAPSSTSHPSDRFTARFQSLVSCGTQGVKRHVRLLL